MDIYQARLCQSKCNTTNGSDTETCVVIRAGSDPTMSGDLRSLHHLTAGERTCQVSAYFGTVQRDIQPYMRRLLAEWMLQVNKGRRY